MSQVARKIVITGGSGFVGGYLQKEIEVAWPDAIVESWDLPEIDVTDPKTYQAKLERLRPDWIVHLAAIASVPAAISNPDKAFQINTEGTKLLIESIQSHSQDTKLLFVSTADVYGMAAKGYSGAPIPELPISEADPANPYAESKRGAEILIEEMFSSQCIRVRPFPHIGAGQGLGFVSSDFASQIAAIEVGKQEPVIKVGNLTAQRDFTNVRDVVRAYRLLIEQGELGEVYHVASGVPTSIQSVLDILLTRSTKNISVTQDESRMRPSDIPVLVGDASKLQKTTGWHPTISLDQSLTEVLEWWRSNTP